MSERDDHTLDALDLLRPYDDSMWEHFYMYDNMPYSWDSDIEKHLSIVSGNLIKSYCCIMKNEPYVLKSKL